MINFLFLSLFLFSSQEKVIRLPLTRIVDDYTLKMLRVKEEKVLFVFYLKIGQTVRAPIFYEKNKKDEWPEGSEYMTLFINNSKIPSVILTEKLFVDNIEIPMSYYSILHDEDEKFAREAIALAYDFADKKFSFIYGLYNRGLINRPAYSFSLSAEKNTMILGKPEQKEKYSTYCKVNDYYSNWGCNLNYAHAGKASNYFDARNSYAYFDMNERKIYSPKEFVDLLRKTTFKEQYERTICKDSAGYYGIVCMCDYLGTLPNLFFSFGKEELSVPISKLFKDYQGFCSFLIEGTDDKGWIFGSVFMENYRAEFDYEESKITFYSAKPFSLESIGAYKGGKKVSIVTIIILLVGLSILVKSKMGLRYKREIY